MIHHLILSPDAYGHIRSATRWYVLKEINLPGRFLAELDEILDSIAENPYRFRRVRGSVRRALMKRFPYSVYFVLAVDTVYVAGILHQRQLSPWNRP